MELLGQGEVHMDPLGSWNLYRTFKAALVPQWWCDSINLRRDMDLFSWIIDKIVVELLNWLPETWSWKFFYWDMIASQVSLGIAFSLSWLQIHLKEQYEASIQSFETQLTEVSHILRVTCISMSKWINSFGQWQPNLWNQIYEWWQ
jgi:hypothetical protein